ncbi:hypothetical protein F5B20DRAFT_548680 [Whalleya microplaca]|nr:hypothetical protein F5B20DRAFT_548680 [Whalleya microplaca]
MLQVVTCSVVPCVQVARILGLLLPCGGVAIIVLQEDAREADTIPAIIRIYLNIIPLIAAQVASLNKQLAELLLAIGYHGLTGHWRLVCLGHIPLRGEDR